MLHNCIMKKLTILSAVASAILASCLHANTVYTYTGHAFDYVGTSTYYGAPVTNISGYFTLASALGANTTTHLNHSDFVNYSFTDGRFTSDFANYVATNSWFSAGGQIFTITTDGFGQIANWDLIVQSYGASLYSVNNPFSIAGYQDTGIWDNTNANPSQPYDAYTSHQEVGTWTVSPPPTVPDSGSTASMLVLAFASLATSGVRRLRSARVNT